VKPIHFAKISREQPSWMVFIKIFYQIVLFVIISNAIIMGGTYYFDKYVFDSDISFYIALIISFLINSFFVYKQIIKIFTIWKDNFPEM
jgi:hypothetical protein